MPVSLDELNSLHDEFRGWYGSEPSTLEAVTNELTKSYGFGRNPDGTWDWSPARIAQSFKDEPLWTTLDWAAIAVPVLKWGASIRAVKAGSVLGRSGGSVGRALGVTGDNSIRRALEAGRFAGEVPRGTGGFLARNLNRFVNPETARAAEVYRAGPGRMQARIGGRTIGFSNPLTVEDEYFAYTNKWDMEVWERRGYTRVLDRERVMQEAEAFRTASDVQLGYNRSGLSKAQLQRVEALQRGRVRPDDRLVSGALRGDANAIANYRADFDFRVKLHEDLFDAGLISKETYERGLASYGPNMSQQWEQIKEAAQRSGLQIDQILGESTAEARAARGAREARRTAVGEKARALEAEKSGQSITDLPPPRVSERGALPPLQGGRARLEPRKMTDAEFRHFDRQVLDPRASLETLGKAAQLVARQRFAQRLAGSVVAASGDEMLAAGLRILSSNNAAHAAIWGVDAKKMEGLREILGRLPKVGRQLTGEEVGRALGWKPVDELFAKVPGYAERLPRELRGKWIDPAAAEDVVGGLEFLGETSGFDRFYQNAVNLFRSGKTAYNPATWVRNAIGGVFFSHYARGGGIKLAPLAGLAAWLKGGEHYEAWRSAIGAGASFSVETQEMLRDAGLALAKSGRQASALDWMGQSKFAQLLQKGASAAEEGYRAIDEIWSLDTFIELTQKHQKAGRSLDDARRIAVREIRKFMPNYQLHSDLANALRQGVLGRPTAIPFASFTTETARIYKNLLQEKPHLVLLWNHAFESMAQAFGAFGGYTPSQIEEAQKALPEYQQGKKMLLLPFNVDGAPAFVDMSYMIPLGNLGEAQQAEASFLGSALDVTANPLLNTAVAAVSGQDPFSGSEIEPRVTERQLGIPVTNQRARKLVGLAEHMAAMMLPPLVPPGYAGTNILEWARGQVNPATDQPLERGVARTIMANLAGMRAETVTVQGQVQNVRREDQRRSAQTSQAWKRWEFARAQGNESAMEREAQRIIEIRMESGYTESQARSYFQDSASKRGPLSNLSRRQLREIGARTRRLGNLVPQDDQVKQLEKRERMMALRSL